MVQKLTAVDGPPVREALSAHPSGGRAKSRSQGGLRKCTMERKLTANHWKRWDAKP